MANTSRKSNQKYYRSLIEKWLHFDQTYSYDAMKELFKFENGNIYLSALEYPFRYFTIEHMELIKDITGKTISEVFWACYRRPIGQVLDDELRVKTILAMDKAGIR